MRAVHAHAGVFIRERTAESSKICTLYARIGVKTKAVDAVLGSRIFGNLLVRAMATQLMGVIHPPAHSVCRVVARIFFRTATYLTDSVWHSYLSDFTRNQSSDSKSVMDGNQPLTMVSSAAFMQIYSRNSTRPSSDGWCFSHSL